MRKRGKFASRGRIPLHCSHFFNGLGQGLDIFRKMRGQFGENGIRGFISSATYNTEPRLGGAQSEGEGYLPSLQLYLLILLEVADVQYGHAVRAPNG